VSSLVSLASGWPGFWYLVSLVSKILFDRAEFTLASAGRRIVQIGVDRAALVDAVGVAPEMLAVPATRCAEAGYGFRASVVDENDAVRFVGISVQLGQCAGRVGITAAVLDDTVIVDDVVKSGLEFVTRFVDGWSEVVIGRISLGETDKCNRTST